MKNLLKLAIAALLIFSFTTTQAQVKFGPKAGLNLSAMTLKMSGVGLDPKALMGFHAGVIAEISLTDLLKVQPGFLYSTKGAKYEVTQFDMKMSPGFIEIPINMIYNVDLNGTMLGLFAGRYLGYGVGGTAESQGESASIRFGTGDDYDMKPLDFGINLGAGLNVADFIISAQYQLGMLNLAPVDDYDAEMKIRGFSISLAYLFGMD